MSVKQILGNLFNFCLLVCVCVFFDVLLYVYCLIVLYLFCSRFEIGHCAVKLAHE
jgi:hypothetical protein